MDLAEYERDGRAKYLAFAGVVAAILRESARAIPTLRLQSVMHRAKAVESLEKKLAIRGLSASESIESQIRDLAGCRVIFYTNSSVNDFLRSRIVRDNFEIVDVKVHQPKKRVDNTAELYVSIHYLVTLNSARSSLVEYAQFTSMRCEIQIQTILNHSWAEMAHDTIYKAPNLTSGFGSAGFKKIKLRLGKIMQKYLIPAGYEFDKVVADFEKLKRARALFDADPIGQLVDAANNNERANAIEVLTDTLPYFDDLRQSWSDIAEAIASAAEAALKTEAVPIETEIGNLDGVTADAFVSKVVELLTRYRYVDLDVSWRVAGRLSRLPLSKNGRNAVDKFGVALARYELDAWEKVGHGIQSYLVKLIASMSPSDRDANNSLVRSVLRSCLGSQLEGTSSTSTSVTWRRGATPPSASLRLLRKEALGLLIHQLHTASDETTQRQVIEALDTCTRSPNGSPYSSERAILIASDTEDLLAILSEIAPMTPMLLREDLEDKVFHYHRRYSALPPAMQTDEELILVAKRIVSKCETFRDAVNANSDFVVFKTLVGFHAIFAPAWGDESFDFRKAAEYRSVLVEELLDAVPLYEEDHWVRLITLCAGAKSDDLATFPTFHEFLRRLGETYPVLTLAIWSRASDHLSGYLPAIIAGLMNSGNSEALSMIERWIDSGDYLASIAGALGATTLLPSEEYVARLTRSAVGRRDYDALLAVLRVAIRLSERKPGAYIRTSFDPALSALLEADDRRWLHMSWYSWLGSGIVAEMTDEMADRVLRGMLTIPDLVDDAEYVVAGLAERYPSRVLDFLGQRLALEERARGERLENYQALPFGLYALGEPLRRNADLLLAAARAWFEKHPASFGYRGAYFVAGVFKGHERELVVALDRYAAEIDQATFDFPAFAMAILGELEEPVEVIGLVRRILAALAEDHSSWPDIQRVLEASGVVSGEYGHVDLYADRKKAISPWLSDEDANVRAFAVAFDHLLDNEIAQEQARAQASVAARRLEYDEPIDDLLSLVEDDDDEAPSPTAGTSSPSD